jgi:hypothetical protein
LFESNKIKNFNQLFAASLRCYTLLLRNLLRKEEAKKKLCFFEEIFGFCFFLATSLSVANRCEAANEIEDFKKKRRSANESQKLEFFNVYK